MTGKRWREVVETFVTSLEHDLAIELKWEDGLDIFSRTSRENGVLNVKLDCVDRHIKEFKEQYLNRETADDFDE